MNKLQILILITICFSQYKAQTETCYQECFTSTGCQQNDSCTSQLFFCDNSCESYSDPKLELECINDCAKSNYQNDKLSPVFAKFIECQTSCIDGIKRHSSNATGGANKSQTQQQKQKEENLTEKQKLRQFFEENPTKHTGETLAEIDCKNIKKKKQAFILKGNTHEMIYKYFQSRCDYIIMPDSKKRATNYDFKWVDFFNQHNYKAFNQNTQIINHVQNLKALISIKDKIVLTYRDFDKKKMYKFDSNDFHFDTYLFNLDSTEYNEEELDFFNNVNDGLWVTKDPDGSLGLGIQLFKNVQEIKDRIKALKADQVTVYTKKDRIKQFSCIQKYMEKPLLIDNKKIDLRGYVLIASLDPFVVLYQNGFVRQCIKDYDTDFTVFNQDEAYKHLTNRIYQKKHPLYEQKKEDLMITPNDFVKFLKNSHNFTDQDVQNLFNRGKETVAYTMMAAKEKFIKKKGIFQLMGVDLIWDEKFDTRLIEFNTSAGLYTTLEGHKNVVPQLVQSTLDLILETFEDVSKIEEKWSHPENLELGRWEILINDVTGYNILDSYLNTPKQEQQTKDDL